MTAQQHLRGAAKPRALTTPQGKPYRLSQAATDAWNRYADRNRWNRWEINDLLSTLEPLDPSELDEPIRSPETKILWSRDYPELIAVVVDEPDKAAVIAIRRRPRPKTASPLTVAIPVPQGLPPAELWGWAAGLRAASRDELARHVPSHVGDQRSRVLVERIGWLTGLMIQHADSVSEADRERELPGIDLKEPPVLNERGLRLHVYQKFQRLAKARIANMPTTDEYQAARKEIEALLDDAKDVLHWSEPMRVEREARLSQKENAQKRK